MKVLRVIARLNTGGPARHVVVLDRGLRDRGYDTVLVHGHLDSGEGSLEGLAGEAALRTVRLPELGRRVRLFDDCRALLKLVRLAFEETPDIIHTHTAKAGALGRLAALAFNATRRRSRRSLVVHTFHGHVFTDYFGPRTTTLVKLTERCLATITDRIITISPAQRHDIVSRFKIASADQTVVIPLGLDLHRLLSLAIDHPTLRGELALAEQDLVIGFVGRLVRIKDLPTLIKAFAILLDAVPDAALVIAGDGPVRPELEALVQATGLEKRVRFLGWSTDLGTLYATLDICALSSLNEGTPVAVIEAMAAGKAIVATNVGGVGDIVEHGVTGLLVPARNAERLANAFRTLASDPAGRRRMGQAARASVATRFTCERLVDEVDRLYSSALAQKRGGYRQH